MVIVAENVPVDVVVTVDGVVVNGLLSNLIVIAVLAAKLLPDTVTTVPVGPEVGESVMPVAVVVTVNIADSVFVPSVADTI
jgi:hypothetical protein